ncbi:MAG: uncharacterized protein K0S79_2730 [Nitrospira sp.]|nr:uncharacterized protein [Nitrospira sp.]
MTRFFTLPRYAACLLAACGWMLTPDGLVPVAVSAVQTESQAEKQANFKQQALGELFHRWTFDQQKPGDALSGFSQYIVGSDAAPVWTVSAEADAPSPPNILKAESSCQTVICYQLLVAHDLHYEYPDVTVRLRFPAEGGIGQGGIVIGLHDERHFYAAIVDLAAKKVEVVRVLDDQVTVLGETAITPKAVEWHSLRMNRDTIISKDVIEVFFDGRLLLSVQDQTLGLGQVGLLVRGNSPMHFDSLHAVPLFSQRPVSNPPAY